MRSRQEAGGARVTEREYCKHDSHGTGEPGRATRAGEVIEYKSVIMKIRLIG
jgi:hypothetical protein